MNLRAVGIASRRSARVRQSSRCLRPCALPLQEGSSSEAGPSASAPLKPSDPETEEELKRPLNPQAQPSAPPLPTGQPGGGGGGAAAAAAGQGEGAQGQQGQGQGRPPRRPLVLPCGHAFCEFCITQ